jgi:hypothetical protein
LHVEQCDLTRLDGRARHRQLMKGIPEPGNENLDILLSHAAGLLRAWPGAI